MATVAPSMDIQVSSNFERLLFDLYHRDAGAVAAAMSEQKETGSFTLPQGALAELRRGFASGRSAREETLAVIARVHRETGVLLDPHTAIGVVAAEANRGEQRIPMITLATAHPAKFPDAVEEAAGLRPPLPPGLADLYERQERLARVPNDLAAVETAVRERRRPS
jgi:threonine synthase